jgi:hypothetical protein
MHAGDSPSFAATPILSLSDILSLEVPLIYEGVRTRGNVSDFIFNEPFSYFSLSPDISQGPYLFYTTLPQALKVLSPLLISKSTLFKKKVSSNISIMLASK